MKCSLDWVRVSHLLFTFSILRKNLPLKSLKRLNLNQMARITSAKTKLIFFKSNKKMSELSVLGKFKHPKNCDMQREFHI